MMLFDFLNEWQNSCLFFKKINKIKMLFDLEYAVLYGLEF
jgi:hypothetical protein